MSTMSTTMTPMLSVPDPLLAIEFYEAAFGAVTESLARVPDGSVYAHLTIGEARFAVTPEGADHGNLGPRALGGTTVRLSLVVADPDEFAERAVAAGARVMFPIADQPYGMRQGRIEDPFGHQWLIGRPLDNA